MLPATSHWTTRGYNGLRAVALGLSALVFGCSLPNEQLSLPGPLTGSIKGSDVGSAAGRGGVAMGTPADRAARISRGHRGDGVFTSATDGSSSAAEPAAGSRSAAPAGTTNVDVRGDGVSLNLVGASIPAVAKTVLGDALGLTYAVSEAVKGTITVATAKPIPKAQLLAVFEQLIRAEGAVIVVENGIYSIVPAGGVQGAGLGNRRAAPRNVGYASEIVPLRYISAEEMHRILRALVPESAVARMDESRNLLIVSGTGNELAAIRDAVQTFDVDWMRGMSIGIYPVESADPESIAQELDTVFGNDRASPVKGIVRFVPNRRLKSVMVISSRPEYLTKAETWIKRIDLVGEASRKQVHVYHVQTRPATEVARLLQQVYTPAEAGQSGAARGRTQPGSTASDPTQFSPPPTGPLGGQGTIPLGVTSTPGAIEPQPLTSAPSPLAAAGTPGGVPGVGAQPEAPPATTGSIPGGAARAPDDDRNAGIQIIADDANNSVVVTATAAEWRRVKQILTRLDVAPNQVLLEATIAEITLNDQLKFGVRWFFQKGASSATLTDSAAGAVAPRFPGFSYFLNLPHAQVALNALADVTDVNIVSSPSLMVLDNKQAVLQVGDEVPIATQSAVSVAAPGAPIVNSVSFRSTGVILRIRPRIGDNGRILLDIEQEVSDVVPTTSSTIDSPTIQQRRIKTTVAVPSGESIVLAGFMQDRASKVRKQVPLLGNVPVIGNLFKDKDDTVRRTELLIAITPHVVRDPNKLRSIAAEYRDRMNFTTRPQRRAPPDRREQLDRVLR